jgi:beta-lactamase class A
MFRVKNFSILRWISLALFTAAVLLLVIELVAFSRMRSGFAYGTEIADVPVGGLTLDEAADRLNQAYSVPVELHYGSFTIQVKPANLGFELNLNAMVTAADQERVAAPFWSSFWNFLFNKMPTSGNVPLVATIDETALRNYLVNEIAARYDQPAQTYQPVPGSTNFEAGNAGTELNVDRSMDLVKIALQSPASRVVTLSVNQTNSSKPSLNNLKVLLEQLIDVSEFTGLTEIYLLDLQTGQEMQLAYQEGTTLPPNISFSAASTIKIPIMISTYRQATKPVSTSFTDLIQLMIEESDNNASDTLMKTLLDPNIGPKMVTDDMKALGLSNTFLTTMFASGSFPVIMTPVTSGNSRSDISTDPDPYSQTTPAEMGSLLADIYQCAKNGGGALAAVFPGEIAKSDCQSMILYLSRNDQPSLLREGLPNGTQIAHKHGWITNVSDYLTHDYSDAAIIYTPGGDYVLCVYQYDSNQILYDNANQLFANISRAVYNYYNLTSQ